MNCPICNEIMSPTVNGGVFLCRIKRSFYVPEFQDSISYEDCAVEINPSGGQYYYQRYNLIPFRITIRSPEVYVQDQSGTVISKLTGLKRDYHYGEDLEPYQKWEKVFQTSVELNLPWNDYNRCIDKIKKLIIFS